MLNYFKSYDITLFELRKKEQKKLDYMKFYEQFGSYEELREYTKSRNPKLKTMKQVDKFIADKMPLESYFQTKIKEYIEKKFPDAFVWKAAAGASAGKTQGRSWSIPPDKV